MRHMERDGEHIWLRQSVTYTTNGQTRTVEIAMPLQPGAAQDEIEALLREADDGMARLTRHLDAHVAALTTGGTAPAVLEPPSPTAEPTAPQAPAPAPHTPTASLTPPTSPAPTQTSTAHPTTPPPVPAAPATAAQDRPSGAAAQASSTSSTSSTPLSLPQFLQTAQAELGLNSRQAMEKLGVRSLSGLNLHEALNALRRQMLRDDDEEAAAAVTAEPPKPALVPPTASAPTASAPPRSTAAVTSPTTQAPRYFEEELDEPEVVFSEEDNAPVGNSDRYAASADDLGNLEEDAEPLDELNLEEVPDFDSPPVPAAATVQATSTPPTRALPAREHPSSVARAPEAPAASPHRSSAAGGASRSRGVELLGALRAAKGGGVPSSQQRTAYRNIVARELGEEKARTLVHGVYKVQPERLGPEQLEALVSWGKQETFAEEVELVLVALRRAATSQAPANGAAENPPRRAQRTQRQPEE
jgi:hypothetical protein